MFKKIQFNRQELAGSVGDIGTDLPLLVAMVVAANLHVASVLIVFGLMQLLTGLVYQMPMPVQPLKAMATLVIAQNLAGDLLWGAGLSIGLIMLVLSLTGLLSKLAEWIPKTVVRGIQFGLGLKLAILALGKYIPMDGTRGYVLATICFFIVLFFLKSKKYPASLLVLGLGFVYALYFSGNSLDFSGYFGISVPQLYHPSWQDISTGFLILALPQIPLSIGNSIVATQQVSQDLFPERKPLSIKKIGMTYGLMNLIIPFFSGVPACHGSGGMVGHYTFGGRTGGSVIIYGLFFIILGLFFSAGFEDIILIFPLPVLGVILLFEGTALMVLIKDTAQEANSLYLVILIGILAALLPFGFLIALLLGCFLYYKPQIASYLEKFFRGK